MSDAPTTSQNEAISMTAARRALDELDALLHARGRFAIGIERPPWLLLLLVIAIAGFLYGLAMGSFAGRPLQALYSGLKVPLLLAVATLLCLPSFYVVNAILGLRTRLEAALHGILAAQATLAITLASLSPVTLVFYLSSRVYSHAILLNGLIFLLATVAGQTTLTRHYRPLITENPRHRINRRVWAISYVFVAVQMAWVLRPFVGSPDLETGFFRENAWSNAYVVVFETVVEALRGGGE